MSTTQPISAAPAIDSPDMRRAGRDALSLALMDARNHTLHLVSHFEGLAPEDNPALWQLGHVAWYQEWWIARNIQRHRGVRCDPTDVRLTSIEHRADAWWGGAQTPQHASRAGGAELAQTRTYALNTLECTLELIEKALGSDDGLYVYRQALFHEDQHGEDLLVMAQALGVKMDVPCPGPLAVREPLRCNATRWVMGSSATGFSFDNERPAHDVAVPEFDIDAQVVTWTQFVEFVMDGGYDQGEFWQPAGWAWLQGQAADAGRRGPRYVDQIGGASGAVMQTRFGKAMRMLGSQPATHLSWWEADAWCRWAGRRLPAEVEWEVAAHTAASRGFRWGDVWEWTGTTLRAYPGFVPGPDRSWSEPYFGSHKVMRGASFATRARMKHPKMRHWGLPDQDAAFVGFRSCAL